MLCFFLPMAITISHFLTSSVQSYGSHRTHLTNDTWCSHFCQIQINWLLILNTIIAIIFYIISSVIHAFWLVLTFDLLEDRHIDDVIIKTFFNSLLYKTNRFQVAVHLFSNRSQRTSKCGKNISATFLFLPHFVCDLLLNRHTATWNLFVK